ncbi:translation initiation factor IF-3 [Thiogranum longum]|uniref:translation initiation factor IF-3 n=1 Tax=Thiogranum longum TaxID=1537524 RepID=UPI00104617C8|nr:translation initiation factor IF-3 [Thiogranum longum]
MAAANKLKHRLNQSIDATEVRLVGAEGEQIGVVPLAEALEKAAEASLDLVEISPQAEPPVCKIMDYGKYRFDEQKKRQAARKKQKQTQVKEIKFRPGTDIGDYNIKLRNLTRFLNDGDKVKVTLRFRGREMAHQELGRDLLKRVEGDLSELATVEQFPKMEGRQMIMVMAPKKK